MATQSTDIEDAINKAAQAGADLKFEMFGAQDNAKSFFSTVANSTAQVKELFATYIWS